MAMLAGAAIGAVATDGLRAQRRPPVYVATEIDVTNQDAYQNEYAPNVRIAVKAAGGRPISVSNEIIALDREPPKGRVIMQVWDRLELLQAYRNSAAFKEARQIGEKYAKFRS